MLESVDDFRAVQLTQMAYLGIAAGGLTVLTGLNGQISLGHGALMAIGAYTTALLLQDDDPTAAAARACCSSPPSSTLAGRRARSASPPPGCTAPTSPAPPSPSPSRCPGIALYFGDTLGGEQGLRVRVPDAPDWVLDAAYFVTGQDLTPSKYVAYLGWFTLVVAFVAARQPRRAAGSAGAGARSATTRSRPSSPASASAGPGCRRSSSAPRPPAPRAS